MGGGGGLDGFHCDAPPWVVAEKVDVGGGGGGHAGRMSVPYGGAGGS